MADKIELSEYQTIVDSTNNKYFGYFATDNRIYDLICTSPLVTPVITSVKWTVCTNDGLTQKSTSTANSLTVEKGANVILDVKWKWQRTNGYLEPERTSGNFSGTSLPSSNIEVSKNITNITNNSTYTQTLYKDIKVPQVVNGVLVRPTSASTLSTKCSCSVTFAYKKFYGKIISNNPNDIDITKLTATALTTSKSLTLSAQTTAANEYLVYMYPTALGVLSDIIQDGATPIKSAFKENTIEVENEYGYKQNYYVYISMNTGAFDNAKIEFK